MLKGSVLKKGEEALEGIGDDKTDSFFFLNDVLSRELFEGEEGHRYECIIKDLKQYRINVDSYNKFHAILWLPLPFLLSSDAVFNFPYRVLSA